MTGCTAVLREKYPNAARLARATGTGSPRDPVSAGARWLIKVRDYHDDHEWQRILSADEPQDEISYHPVEEDRRMQWEIFADLQLWRFDSELAYNTLAEFPVSYYSTEKVPGIRVELFPDLAGDLLGEIAGRLWSLMLGDLREEAGNE